MREWARRWSWELFLAAILVVVIAVNVSLSEFYLSVNNFVNMFQLSIEKILVVVVMTFVIILGEIDLSVASVMAFAACVMSSLYEHDVAFGIAIVVALAAGAAAGLLQGYLVARRGLPSLAVTLAGLIGFRGAARILLEDRAVGSFPEWFDRLGQDPLVGRFSLGLILFLVSIVLGGIILQRTAFGRSAYVIGNNADVARFSGINVARKRLLILTASGSMAGLAGVLFAARLGSVRANLAEGFELDIITMVLLGGVSIFGGTGKMIGVALSVLIILNLRNGLSLANIASTTQTGIVGALLIFSVLVPNLAQRVRARRTASRSGPGPPAPGPHDGKGGNATDGEGSRREASTERGRK